MYRSLNHIRCVDTSIVTLVNRDYMRSLILYLHTRYRPSTLYSHLQADGRKSNSVVQIVIWKVNSSIVPEFVWA